MNPNTSIKKVVLALRRAGHQARLRSLHRPRAGASLAVLGVSWGLIILSWALTVRGSWCFAPVALVIIGCRQRALGNCLHDASHGALLRNRRLNRLVAIALCGLPLLEDFDQYRERHRLHHKHLGKPGLDPDLVPPCRAGSSLSYFLHHLRDGALFTNSVLGNWLPSSPAARLGAVLWWGAALGVAWLATDLGAAVSAFVLWILARATVYHVIKVFAEISDHTTVVVTGDIFQGTRTLPNNWLSAILNPHGDNYHLAHHLLPSVPTVNLKQADEILMSIDEYRNAPRYRSYLFARDSVARSWVGPAPEVSSP